MHATITYSALKVINHAGHVSNLEQAQEFNKHLCDFVTSTGGDCINNKKSKSEERRNSRSTAVWDLQFYPNLTKNICFNYTIGTDIFFACIKNDCMYTTYKNFRSIIFFSLQQHIRQHLLLRRCIIHFYRHTLSALLSNSNLFH